MKISIFTQLAQICLCWLAGVAAGFLYDAFKVLRRESGIRALTAFLDALFCVAVCFTMFVIGMSAGQGSLGIEMAVFALLGFTCYIFALSGSVYKLFHRFFRKLKSILSVILLPIRKILGRISETTKCSSTAVVKWCKRIKKRGEKSVGKTERKQCGGYRNYGDDAIWNV